MQNKYPKAKITYKTFKLKFKVPCQKFEMGKSLMMSYDVQGVIRLYKGLLKGGKFKTSQDFDEILEEYVKFWIMDAVHVKTYPLGKK